MKKRGVFLVLVTLILLFTSLLLAMPLAFAVENVTENETVECSMTFTDDYCPPTCSTDDDSDCCEQAEKCVVDNECTDCVEMKCVDSDGGKNYYVRGKAEVPCAPGEPCPLCTSICSVGKPCATCEAQSDWCSDEFILNEGYCEDTSVIYEEYTCPEGCMDGACLKEPEAQCGEHAECLSEETMYCEGSNACTRTTEFECIEGRCVASGGGGGCNPCPYGCEDGACLASPEPEPRPEVCAARITISFDKNVYYIGEEFKVEIGIFDSQGNPIPNYLFYIKIYDYDKGMWHTSSQEDRTDGSGYKIHQDKMKVGEPFRFGKNKLKIYTDVGGCNLVEDIAIIEIKRKKGPEPVPCGMGSCVPEPGPIDVEPVNISDERGFYSCSGCEVDKKCYPIGYRKKGEYCSDNNEFVSQIDGKCDNSFECASNVCISGECLTESFVEKIIEWIKVLLGIKPKPPVEKACSKLLLEHNIGEYKYEKSVHGEDEHTQAPLFSEDGKHLGTIKCCAALYKDKEDIEHGVLFCPYDSKEEVTNSVKWLIAKERNIIFKEFRNEKVFGDDKGQVVAWTNNAYLIAVGVGPAERNSPLPEDLAEAYLKKYPSEFELTEDDIPDAPPERPWVYCTEEDEKKGNKCVSQPGAQLQTDPHPENKSCEVYVGCVLPHEKCEGIDDIKEKEDCYVGVAEITGDSSICEKITSDESRKNKCYVKAAETSNDASICEKITDAGIKNMCLELAKEISPWVTCKSEEDMSKEECHFIDDFESGLGKWVFSSEGAGSEVVENGNTVLRLVGVERANVHKIWDNYLFKFRFKMISGSVHVDFRRSESHAYGAKRYLVAISERGVNNLNKQISEYWKKLEEIDLRLDNNWHTLEIRCYNDVINVYVDNELVAEHKDTIGPLLSGWVRFEAHTGGVPGMVPELLIDDVEIKLITEEDIIYP